MTSEKATAALILELRAIALLLEVKPTTIQVAPPPFRERIKAVLVLGADALEEASRSN